MFKYTFAIASLMLSGVALADEPSTITLTGQGVVQVEPDEGYITVGVITTAENSAQAVKDNAKMMVALYATLKKEGVTKANIQTVDYSIRENWREEVKNSRSIRIRDGYQVVNMVRVTVCELENFGKILDAVVADGANTISGISFGSSKASELQDQARVLAVEDAMRRAALLVEPLGVNLGSVVSISESSSRYGSNRIYMAAASVESVDSPVSGGTLSFTANVTISWYLSAKPRKIELPRIKIPDGIKVPDNLRFKETDKNEK